MTDSNQVRKKLNAPFLSDVTLNTSMDEISSLLDRLDSHPIDTVCWENYPYKPQVRFVIAHTGNSVLLKYFVTESTLRATYFNPQDPVYKDSCVEMFVRFNDETAYYNFEFNVLGTCLSYFGPDRHDRVPTPLTGLNSIRYHAAIDRNNGSPDVTWQLIVQIPVTVFTHHKISALSGLQTRANFQKCGDDLPVPHFLVWSPVGTAEPDFHRPEFFGAVYFE